MTEENQKRRDHLEELELIAREALANIDGDPVRYGMALDRSMGRIAGIAHRYMLDHVDRTDTSQCQVCRKPLSEASAYRIQFSPPDKSLANAVLCADCYEFMLAPLIQAAAYPRRS